MRFLWRPEGKGWQSWLLRRECWEGSCSARREGGPTCSLVFTRRHPKHATSSFPNELGTSARISSPILKALPVAALGARERPRVSGDREDPWGIYVPSNRHQTNQRRARTSVRAHSRRCARPEASYSTRHLKQNFW